jgi:hypothetical protein
LAGSLPFRHPFRVQKLPTETARIKVVVEVEGVPEVRQVQGHVALADDLNEELLELDSP